MTYRYEGEWPPPVISRWLEGATINIEDLSTELEFWLNWCEENAELTDEVRELIRKSGLNPEQFLKIWHDMHPEPNDS